MAYTSDFLNDSAKSLYPDFYGDRPVAPPITPTAGTNVPQAIALGTQALSQLPGYQKILGQIGTNLDAQTRGELPPDLINLFAQQAAERGVARGGSGAPNANLDYFHVLGTNALEQMEAGRKGFQEILPTLPGYGLSQNPGQYVLPEQQYERDLQSNIFGAAPLPAFSAANSIGNVKSGYNFGYGGGGGGYSGFQPGAGMTSGDSWWNQPEPNYQQKAVGALPSVGWDGGGGGTDVMRILNEYNPISGGAANPQRDEFAGVDNAYNFGSQYDYNTDPYWGQFGEGE